jgi:hypothetical protein
MLANQSQQCGHIARQTDYLKARRFEQTSDALTQQDIIVCDHDTQVPHGRRSHFVMGVPAPTCSAAERLGR